MTGDPLDRAAEAIRDAMDAGGDFANEPVGMAGVASLEALVEVARAARETRDYLRTVGAEEGNPIFGVYGRLDAALARLGKE